MDGKYLLDTHSFIWWQAEDVRFPRRLRPLLEDESNLIYVSAGTCWEMMIKYRLGKLDLSAELADDVEAAVVESGMIRLPITFTHAQRVVALPQLKHHRDPFDRMLVAQALCEGLTLLSNEDVFDEYGVDRVW